MHSPSSASESHVVYPETSALVVRHQQLGMRERLRNDSLCGKIEQVICGRTLFVPEKNSISRNEGTLNANEERDQQVAGENARDCIGKSALQESALTSSMGLAKSWHSQAMRSVNYSLQKSFHAETCEAPSLPMGMPLAQPPQLATILPAMPSTCTSSCGKRKNNDREASSFDTTAVCDSKVYAASKRSSSGLSFLREMNPDERLFLDVACALSTSTSPHKKSRTPAAQDKRGATNNDSPADCHTTVANKNPMGPPPFALTRAPTSSIPQ